MALVSKDDFLKWVKKERWLQVNETSITTGRQVTYLAPSGHSIIAQYNIKGELEGILQPIPMPVNPTMPLSPPGLNLKGRGRFPGIS